MVLPPSLAPNRSVRPRPLVVEHEGALEHAMKIITLIFAGLGVLGYTVVTLWRAIQEADNDMYYY